MQNIFQAFKLQQKHQSQFLIDQKLTPISDWIDQHTETWAQLNYPIGEYWKYVSFKDLAAVDLGSLKKTISPVLKESESFFEIHFEEKDITQDANEDFSIARLSRLNKEEIKSWLEKLNKANTNDNPLSQMHLSFLMNTFVLKVNNNKKIRKPILLQWDGFDQLNLLHIIVESGQGAEAEIFFDDKPQGPTRLNSVRVDFYLNENSKINFYRKNDGASEQFSFYHGHAHLKKDSQFKHFDVTFPGRWIRHNINVDLLGEGSQAQLKGAYLSHKNYFCDHHTQILHHVPHTQSQEDYRGILSDETKVVFNGLIGILPNAEKSESQLINKNLMLSQRCEINTKPELKIDNDDVKASHGATVGQLDTDQLFYLLSRGLSEDLSHQILSKAFVAGLTEDENPLVKDFFNTQLKQVLIEMRGDRK